MKFAIEAVAETQKTTLAAAGVFAESVLAVTERLMQLHIELARTAFEQSAEVAHECLDACLVMENAFAPNPFLKLGGD